MKELYKGHEIIYNFDKEEWQENELGISSKSLKYIKQKIDEKSKIKFKKFECITLDKFEKSGVCDCVLTSFIDKGCSIKFRGKIGSGSNSEIWRSLYDKSGKEEFIKIKQEQAELEKKRLALEEKYRLSDEFLMKQLKGE